MSSEQLQKLAELRKQRANAPQPSSNIVQVRQQALLVWTCAAGVAAASTEWGNVQQQATPSCLLVVSQSTGCAVISVTGWWCPVTGFCWSAQQLTVHMLLWLCRERLRRRSSYPGPRLAR